MKPLFIESAFLIMLLLPSSSKGVLINWGAANYPLYDIDGIGGKVLTRGCIVQLIWDQDLDGIDPPGLDGMPKEGDVLIGSSWIGYGSFFEGEFSQNTEVSIVNIGDVVYVRAWSDSLLSQATHYGDTRDHLTNQWTIDNELAYTFDCTSSNSWATVYPVGSETGVDERGLKFGIRNGKFGMMNPFPNPFTKKTTISYSIAVPEIIRLVIYDVAGRTLRVLVDARQDPGQYEVFWDGKDQSGIRMVSGIYYPRLSLASGKSVTEKIVLMKSH